MLLNLFVPIDSYNVLWYNWAI